MASPLGAVTEALERAAARGELSPAELEWSLALLSGRGRNRGRPRSDDRRGEVLAVAARVFLRRGYHHATLDEVAQDLAMTKAGLYHYFGSKQAILEAVCESAMSAADERIAGVTAGPGSVADRLRAVAERYAELFLGDVRLTLLVRHFDDLSEGVQASLRRRWKRIETGLRRTLEEGIREGVFETRDVTVAVLGAVGTFNWSPTWYEPDGPLSRDEVRDVLVEQVLGGVERAPAEPR